MSDQCKGTVASRQAGDGSYTGGKGGERWTSFTSRNCHCAIQHRCERATPCGPPPEFPPQQSLDNLAQGAVAPESARLATASLLKSPHAAYPRRR